MTVRPNEPPYDEDFVEYILHNVTERPGPQARPSLVIVNGRPGAGKSTLSRRLASALACPLVSRDEINEGIRLPFRRQPGLAPKEQVAKTAFDTFFRTIELLITAKVSLVAEAAFQDPLWRLGLERMLPVAELRIVHCVTDQDLADDRIVLRRAERAAAHRPGGEPDAPAAETRWAPRRVFMPLSLPVPSLSVDTTDGYAPRFEEIVSFALADAAG